MTEFETQNTVDVVIDDRSLTEAKADLETALSDVPVDVAVEASGGGGGGEVAARDRARSRQLLSKQTESIDELQETLSESGQTGQWRQQFSLSRERNRILREMLEQQEEDDRRGPRLPGGSAVAGAGVAIGAVSLLGLGALSSILTSFSWPDLPELPEWPEPPNPPAPPEPDWHPLDVVEPHPVEVSVEDPSEAPVEDPKEQPVEEPKEQPVEDPSPVPTPEPDWMPIEVGVPELSASPAADRVGESVGLKGLIAGGVGTALGIEFLRGVGSNSGTAASSSAGAFLTPEAVGVTEPEEMNERRQALNQRTPDWANLPNIPEDKYPGSVFSAKGRQAQAEGARDIAARIESAISNLREDTRGTQEETSSTRSTEVNVETNISVDGATRREVERAAEQAKKEALSEFNQQISGGRVR